MDEYKLLFKVEIGGVAVDNKPIAACLRKLAKIKADLAHSKNGLDDKFKTNGFEKKWKAFDPFSQEKIFVGIISNNYNVSNAWLKCYEILAYYSHYYGIFAESKTVNHFDNAAFPGSFILAAHHYFNTKTKIIYDWRASSLIEKNLEDAEPLEDKYKLWANYPNKWLMSDKMNGDVLVEKNIYNFPKLLESSGCGKVDLYTSDLGFDVSSDYNNQELMQCAANIGQIVVGIQSLKVGGMLVTKQYMFFEPITLSVIYHVSKLFKTFHICKPYTSRQANSEIYLVGLEFLGDEDSYITQLFIDKINEIRDTNAYTPIDDEYKTIPYMNKIVDASEVIFGRQIEKINLDIERCDNFDKGKEEFKKSEEPNIISWYKAMKILPIDKTLNIKKLF
jgi:23S rRNA U2552 (ribose-2'-O)-methylase RlmE/FtsJ